MSNLNIASELFVALSDGQQELVAGGADFELAGSNYANRLANLQGTTASGPAGSAGNSIGTTSAVNTAAQDLLGLGAPAVPTVGALGAAPILTGLAAAPAAGGLGGLGGFGTPGLGGII
jgi:hypothetical protein